MKLIWASIFCALSMILLCGAAQREPIRKDLVFSRYQMLPGATDNEDEATKEARELGLEFLTNDRYLGLSKLLNYLSTREFHRTMSKDGSNGRDFEITGDVFEKRSKLNYYKCYLNPVSCYRK